MNSCIILVSWYLGQTDMKYNMERVHVDRVWLDNRFRLHDKIYANMDIDLLWEVHRGLNSQLYRQFGNSV